ncbi:MAG: sigma-70 family RNA polymerase sigma factor [Chloroflexi bacterium]|nr:MAG: sigma-70 family RNA polymerase sigma factor [Chloroflexota bacterium]TMD82352.1 MAG: sigma-70 family RNA polymerase sigma factor [Chloroflexota bacterium]
MGDLAVPGGAECPKLRRPQPAMGAEELCRNYGERVFRFAAMVARADAEAEDIAQEALLKAIRRLDAYDPRRGSMETWLWRIVVNTARDAGRAAGRRVALWERLRRLPEETESVESIVVKRLSDAQLLSGVRSLPPRDRTLIALRFGAGLDHAATGSAVGISSGAATMAVRRALRKLRNRLEATYEQDT